MSVPIQFVIRIKNFIIQPEIQLSGVLRIPVRIRIHRRMESICCRCCIHMDCRYGRSIISTLEPSRGGMGIRLKTAREILIETNPCKK